MFLDFIRPISGVRLNLRIIDIENVSSVFILSSGNIVLIRGSDDLSHLRLLKLLSLLELLSLKLLALRSRNILASTGNLGGATIMAS